MKYEIIYTEHYAFIVSDEEIKEGDFNVPSDFDRTSDISITSKEDLEVVNDKFNGYKKVIAHRPLTNTPILEGVPLLPEFSEENSIKDYSLDTAKEFALNHFNGLESKFPKGGYITIKSILDVLKIGVECGHKFGLKQAKETYKYTEEDMIKCVVAHAKYTDSLRNGRPNFSMWISSHQGKSFLQSLQQPKRPKYFEYEIKFFHDETIPYPKSLGTKPKTTTNSQGQTELVGKYTF